MEMSELEGIDCSHLWVKNGRTFLSPIPTLEQTGGTNRAELFEADIRGNFDNLSKSADSERGDGL